MVSAATQDIAAIIDEARIRMQRAGNFRSSIPTLIVFKGGNEVARQSGAMDLTTLMQWLDSALG